MPCFFYMFCSPFCSMLMLGLRAYMLDIMSMAISCLNLHVCMHFLCSYAYIRVFTCLYAWIHVLPRLCAKFLHVYRYAPMLICLDLCFHMLVRLDLRSLHAFCYIPYACALHAMFVCLDLGYVCHAMCYCSPFVALSFFLVFWPIGSDYGLRHCPYTLAHIKGFGSPILHVYACLLLCFMLVLASLVLGFATLDALSGIVVVWLYPMPMRPCLGVTTWEASPWCQLLRAYLSPFVLCAMICLPCLFVPPVGFICIFTRLLTCPCMRLTC